MIGAETDFRPTLAQVVKVLSVICDENQRSGSDGHEVTIHQLEVENSNK
jgi:hypothetical protein